MHGVFFEYTIDMKNTMMQLSFMYILSIGYMTATHKKIMHNVCMTKLIPRPSNPRFYPTAVEKNQGTYPPIFLDDCKI